MLELLTSEEMGQADRLAIEGGVPAASSWRMPGRAVADEVAHALPRRKRASPCFAVPATTAATASLPPAICSRGATAVQPRLQRRPEPRLPHDAAAMAKAWTGAVEPLCAATLLCTRRESWSMPCSGQGLRASHRGRFRRADRGGECKRTSRHRGRRAERRRRHHRRRSRALP